MYIQNTPPQANSTWVGYKFVGDNIDKNIKPRFQRHDNKGQSLHYYHGYAVRDRLDLSTLSNQRPTSCLPDPSIFYHQTCLMKDDLKILIIMDVS